MPLKPSLVLALIVITACYRELTPPAVPLTLDLQTHLVDGAALPVFIQEYRGAGAHLTSYYLHVKADGLWNAEGYRYPGDAMASDTSFFRDNGVYSFDGTSIV